MKFTRRSFVAAASAVATTGSALAAPSRVVSLNPCIDTILVHLAEPQQIGALSHYARQRQSSTIADVAERLPFTYESAEEIIEIAPDLVLASKHSGRATRQALEHFGIPVETFSTPNSVADSIEMVRRVAKLVGQVDRGEKLIAKIDAAILNAGPDRSRPPIKAIVFQPRGLVAGKGTLVDEMLSRSGFENVAARYGVEKWGNVPLELLVSDPPEILLSPQPSESSLTRAERVVSHPALASIAHLMKRAVFPEACLYCGGPVLLLTAPALAKAYADFWGAA